MLQLSRTIRHRGPDWSGCVVIDEPESHDATRGSILCHERLAIVGVDSGAQPLVSDDGKIFLCVNGEIYNHRQLRKSLKQQDIHFKTDSDCEVIMYLYREHGADFVNMLDGMFSFVLLDSGVTPHRVIAARDPIGITTLYQGHSFTYPGAQYFASELKAIATECERVNVFPPGHLYDSSREHGKELVRYYEPSWLHTDEGEPPSTPVDLTLVRHTLEKAVRKRLMSEVPYGVLLSGGLDSSLIASIAARETEKQARVQQAKLAAHEPKSKIRRTSSQQDKAAGNDDEVLTAWPRLHSFSIGLPGSPDLLAAREAAEFLGTVHHEYTFSVQEGLDALSDVVYHLETYDVTTVRASTPMYLLSRKIKAIGVKMVLSGEGSDEIFGGYLYFHAAPDKQSFHQECVRRVKNLHTADCLRANKSTMAWGLEARVPFLDKAFLDVCMNIDPSEKEFSKGAHQNKDKDGKPYMEKYILRKAFDCNPDDLEAGHSSPDSRPYLPEKILWRQKEQFSDGVGYSWIDGMKQHAEHTVSDEKFAERAERYPIETPETKEAYMIRELFEHWFPSDSAAKTAVRWVPRGDWGCDSDPSGRSVKIHDAAYKQGDSQ
ncbi:asparagine synthase (glutamine-hydrolyzing) [Malassezia yamatoensis]|uniref:asparagine synthase (glutamine-hydrolyzing) n=1 Tax=Malassezia yamatoensis TaxID=253288 RepID=A0AAJ6CJP5_9BASI|nr:asparagine synthase (glutamine-hydrolyzing) [Malassezia yamatoensis]